MLNGKRQRLKKIIRDFIETVSIYLPDDISERLSLLAESETDPAAKTMYDCILSNVGLAKTLHRPICQDTGIPQFFVEVGTKFPLIDELSGIITECVEESTKEIPLRPNTVDPLGESNTGSNVGFRTPYINFDLIPESDVLIIRLYFSGGGCSLPGRSRVLMPLEGEAGIKRFVYETVAEWGVNACPPLFVGIGVGACAVTAAELSKRALLRPVGSFNPEPEAARLEKEIEDGLNSLGIAPLGFGGNKSVLGVNIETAGRHPATLGVGLSFGCWATRRGEIDITAELDSEIITHKRLKEGKI